MVKKINSFFIFFLISFISISTVFAENEILPNEIWVSVDGSGDGYSIDNPTNLSNSMSNIQNGMIINFLDGNYDTSEYLIKNRNVTLQAVNSGNVTFNGNNLNPIFRIGGNYITLSGFNFINGFSRGYGGAIDWYGSYGTISNCTFLNNYANSGGAVFWENSYGTMINCTFINNQADSAGAVHWSGEYGNIINSTFISNIAKTSDGGAVHWSSIDGLILNSYFKNNQALLSVGGAIYWSGSNEKTINCTFISNNDKYGTTIYSSNSLYLSNNSIDSIVAIYNDGIITSLVNVIVLENQTLASKINEKILITATVADDRDNRIIGKDLIFKINNDSTIASVNKVGQYYIEYSINANTTLISAQYNGGDNVNVKNALIIDNSISLTANDIVMYYRNGTQYKVTLKDSLENPIIANVTISINGKNYIVKTNSDGIATLDINLNPGNYTISSTYANQTITNNLEVLSTLYGFNLIKYFGNDSQYFVKALNIHGDLLKNSNITFNLNGIFYTRTTDSNGIATLNIDLNPGEYIVTAIGENGLKISNNITVLPILEKNNTEEHIENEIQHEVKDLYKNNMFYPAKVAFNIIEGSMIKINNVVFNANQITSGGSVLDENENSTQNKDINSNHKESSGSNQYDYLWIICICIVFIILLFVFI